MKKENNKYSKIIKILVIILILISLAFLGLVIYRNYLDPNKYIRENIKIQHGSSTGNNKETTKIILDSEDVKKWLNDNSGIKILFIEEKNNFDYQTADNHKYSGILGWYLIFGGTSNNAVNTKTLDGDSKYTYEYTYSLDYIKKILNKYFGVDMNVIDPNLMNTNFNEFANFGIENNTFIVKVIATGLDNYYTSKIKSVSLNEDNNIVVNYELSDCTGPECLSLGNRELLLKKVENGFNILKAYDVKN